MNEGDGAATLTDSGALSFADLDSQRRGDGQPEPRTTTSLWSGGTLNAALAAALVAGFSVDQDSWDYSTSQNLDFLGAGETITFSYDVVATDDSGAGNAACGADHGDDHDHRHQRPADADDRRHGGGAERRRRGGDADATAAR